MGSIPEMVHNPLTERVTLAEAARRLGTTRQNLQNLSKRYPPGTPGGFPAFDDNVVGANVVRWQTLRRWYESREDGRRKS